MPLRKGIGTTLMVVIVVVVMAAAAIAFVAISNPSVPRATTTTPPTSSTGPPTTDSTISGSGLQLRVVLNSSSIQSREEVAVQMELLNTLGHNVSLAVVPDQNISGWNGEDFFCSLNPSHSLVGFALFDGRFAARNISAAGSPLQLAAPSEEIPCPYSPLLNDTIFLPNSDKTVSFGFFGQTDETSYPVTAGVNATTGYCVGSPLAGECRGSSGILGYWNASSGYAGNATLASKGFTYLPAGEYTVVAMDDWGQTVYAHFQVTAAPSISSSKGQTHTAAIIPDSTDNLQLQLSLNATSSSAAGVSVSIFVDEYNPLASTDDAIATNDWLVALNHLDVASCGDDGPTVGFAVAEGYYTSSNVTTARFLDLVDPGATYNCPLYLGYANPTGYLFQPMSETATSYSCIGVSPSCPTGSASTGVTRSSWGTDHRILEPGRSIRGFPTRDIRRRG
jgi:hypothetical protein